MFIKLMPKLQNVTLTMSSKLVLGLSAIAAILLLSSVISILEYRRMSNYVSDLIASNINCINISQKLANYSDKYNLEILAAIGDATQSLQLDTDYEAFMEQYDSLVTAFSSKDAVAKADSVVYSYTAYMLTSLELENVMMSDFIDSREWYFNRLQPKYQRLKSDIENLNDMIYHELKENSYTFQDSFYRSIVPGVVSVGAGLLLVLLLMVFILIYYVRPLKKMLAGIDNYHSFAKHYGYTFEGDDELVQLNEGVCELIDENIELKRRVKQLRDERDRMIESSATVKEL